LFHQYQLQMSFFPTDLFESHSIITETLAKDYGNTRKDQSDSG